MNRRNAAFTLVELMIAMAIVTLVLYAAINFFIISVRQYKVQTKIIETNVEGILGLELFRQDLESLGFGLPWNSLGNYTEKTGNGSALNDGNNIAPRAVVSINGATFTWNNSDYLVIKSARVGMSDAAGKWTTLTQANVTRTWTPASENLVGTDTSSCCHSEARRPIAGPSSQRGTSIRCSPPRAPRDSFRWNRTRRISSTGSTM